MFIYGIRICGVLSQNICHVHNIRVNCGQGAVSLKRLIIRSISYMETRLISLLTTLAFHYLGSFEKKKLFTAKLMAGL